MYELIFEIESFARAATDTEMCFSLLPSLLNNKMAALVYLFLGPLVSVRFNS